MQSIRQEPARGTLLNLQALRALAALAVVYLHFAISRHIQLPEFGSFGVELFFVISGFIIAHVAGSDPVQFFVRRLIRIVPMYWLVTLFWFCVAFVAPSISDGEVTIPRLITSLLFIPNGLPVVVRGWTLNYEMYFYVVFTVGMLISARWAPALATAIIGAVAGAIFFLPGLPAIIAFYGSPLVFEFLLGLLAYHLWVVVGRLPRVQSAIRQNRYVLLAALGLLVVVCALNNAGAPVFSAIWVGIPAFLIVLGGVSLETYGNLHVRSRIVRLLGDASYTIYLVHPFVLLPLQRWVYPNSADAPLLLKLGYLLVAVTLVCVVSVAIHLTVERPMTKRLSNVYKWHQARRKSALVTSTAPHELPLI